STRTASTYRLTLHAALPISGRAGVSTFGAAAAGAASGSGVHAASAKADRRENGTRARVDRMRDSSGRDAARIGRQRERASAGAVGEVWTIQVRPSSSAGDLA